MKPGPVYLDLQHKSQNGINPSLGTAKQKTQSQEPARPKVCTTRHRCNGGVNLLLGQSPGAELYEGQSLEEVLKKIEDLKIEDLKIKDHSL